MSELDEVKVGDKLIRSDGKKVYTVRRISDTQIIVDGGYKFRKRDGRCFLGYSIRIPTDGEIEMVQIRDKIRQLDAKYHKWFGQKESHINVNKVRNIW